jgi:hypothetical protein
MGEVRILGKHLGYFEKIFVCVGSIVDWGWGNWGSSIWPCWVSGVGGCWWTVGACGLGCWQRVMEWIRALWEVEGGEDPRGGGRLRVYGTVYDGLGEGGLGSVFRKRWGWVRYFFLDWSLGERDAAVWEVWAAVWLGRE